MKTVRIEKAPLLGEVPVRAPVERLRAETTLLGLWFCISSLYFLSSLCIFLLDCNPFPPDSYSAPYY